MIKKIFEKDLSCYRIPLENSKLYFGHGVKVKDEDYVDINFEDIIKKIDEMIEVINKLLSIPNIKDYFKFLEAKALEVKKAEESKESESRESGSEGNV